MEQCCIVSSSHTASWSQVTALCNAAKIMRKNCYVQHFFNVADEFYKIASWHMDLQHFSCNRILVSQSKYRDTYKEQCNIIFIKKYIYILIGIKKLGK